ncbi:hypothetical protein Cgig2_028472 [Carnegiea gigantea]|uniref:Vacuolar ATPase assembly integral membrane protein VMA21 homolog n=1 Tax=Carnegiea gigantea TaxID=171969 RepID=A0A9Q1K9Z0_9CARY|nr:hypothetical protein Cgig2_028472 [Carnegiea gigantea]
MVQDSDRGCTRSHRASRIVMLGLSGIEEVHHGGLALMAEVKRKFFIVSIFMWTLPIAILYGFQHDWFPGKAFHRYLLIRSTPLNKQLARGLKCLDESTHWKTLSGARKETGSIMLERRREKEGEGRERLPLMVILHFYLEKRREKEGSVKRERPIDKPLNVNVNSVPVLKNFCFFLTLLMIIMRIAGFSHMSPYSQTLLSGLLAVVSVNIMLAFYVIMAMREPSGRHEPDPVFVAKAKASIKQTFPGGAAKQD